MWSRVKGHQTMSLVTVKVNDSFIKNSQIRHTELTMHVLTQDFNC
jgi:hypothetical protein